MALITQYGTSNVSQRGMFTQGTIASFILTFFDIDGNSYDPTDITIYIYDPDDTLLETIDALVKIDVGEYAGDYAIETDATTGAYTLRYTFVSQTESGEESRTINETFLVIEEASQGAIYAQTQNLIMRSYLETLIRYSQRIPVKAEQVIWDKNRRKGKLTFGNWNQPTGAMVHRNNNLITTGFETDYVRGEIEFDTALEKTDIVDVSYNFRWFSEGDLDNFMSSGVNRVNYYPPVTNYTIGNTPSYWVFVAMWGAAVDAIRTFIMDLIHQEPQIVLGGPEIAQKMIDVLDGQKKNFEEDLHKALDLKKYGNYAGLTHTIIVPEYTLPGGRCFSFYSRIIYRKKQPVLTVSSPRTRFASALTNENVYTNDTICSEFHVDTIENICQLMESGEPIEVLSDRNGVLSFETVSKIWRSGKKPLIRIETNTNDCLDVSEEHIVFVNGAEMPARDIEKGDWLEVLSNDKIIKTQVKNMELLDETETFDIEVPSTANLFVENIKCHNSRWFRYLFKGSSG